jgi:hypothetical protein
MQALAASDIPDSIRVALEKRRVRLEGKNSF